MNIEQLTAANKRIKVLETELKIQDDAHDQEIKDIEDVNNAISKLADARINRLVNAGECNSEWISVLERMPEKTEDNDGKCYYTFSYGEVRDDEWFSTYPRGSDGWGNKCQGGCFYQPNSDSDYSGEFKADGVTHWMEKPPTKLPEPPK